MVRFLADASLNHYIVAACLRREPALAAAANLEGAPDPWVLALAAEQGRVVVTHDVRTMPRHFGDFLVAGGRSPGVLLVSQRTPIAIVVEWLLLIWAASDPSEWENRILEIPFR
jgi:hypothetical protein